MWILTFLAAGLSAALLWSAYPPCGETANLAVAAAPLLAVSRLSGARAAAWAWFGGGFAFWFGTLAWMPAIVKNGGPLALVVLGWAGLAGLCAGYFALFGWLSARMWGAVKGRGGWWRLAALAAGEPVLWMGCEWLRANLFTGFAWNFLGTALGRHPELAASARWGGVYLASGMVVLLNGVFATLACRVAAQMRREAAVGGRWLRMAETAVPLAVILGVTAGANAGAERDEREAAERGTAVRVALVQRNAPCVFSRGEREDPVEAWGRLMPAAGAAKPDLMVWGESAMCEFGRVDGARARAAAEHFLGMTGGALVAGGDAVEEEGGARKVRNAAALYTVGEGGVEVETYGKQHLVPFGEYIPFDKQVTALQKLSPIGVSLWPGEAKAFRVGLGGGRGECRVAPLICFEDTDPALSRRAAKLGAQAVALITNDSWFSHSQEAVQHAWQAALRAIETGMPVMRTGNSGVTGVIDMRGRAKWLSDGDGKPLTDAAGVMVETVRLPPAGREGTPYVKFGDAPLLAAFGAALAMLAASGAVKRKENNIEKEGEEA